MWNIFRKTCNVLLECDKAYTNDCQGLGNLLEPSVRSPRGFVCASFVSPPVNVLITLPEDTGIDYLVVEPSTGRHSISRLALFVSRAPWLTETLAQEKPDQSKQDLLAMKIAHILKCKPTFVDLKGPEPVVFRLSSTDFPIGDNNGPLRNRGPVHHVTVPHPDHRQPLRTRYLLLRILRTANRSIPCIGGLELWTASPSPRMLDCLSPPRLSTTDHSTVVEEGLTPRIEDAVTPLSRSSSPDVIPDEFQDPITLEVMTRPVLLPSGKHVDQVTLERFWTSRPGQPRADPFTLVPLDTKQNQPELDHALKARIEQFLTTISAEPNRRTSHQKLPVICGRKRRLESTVAYANKKLPRHQSSLANTEPAEKEDEEDFEQAAQRILKRFPWITHKGNAGSSSSSSSGAFFCEFCAGRLDTLDRTGRVYKVLGCGSRLCHQCTTTVAVRERCRVCGVQHTSSQIVRMHLEQLIDSST